MLNFVRFLRNNKFVSIEIFLEMLNIVTFLHLTDACHTLTCAIMLLNTDLHGQVLHFTLNKFMQI